MRYMKYLSMAILLLATVAVNIGCSDDDEVVAPPAPVAYINGTIDVRPECVMETFVSGHGGRNPYLDSAKVGDSLCHIIYDYARGYGDPVYWTLLYEDSDEPMYAPGDYATIRFYSRWGASSAIVSLLDPAASALEVISPQDDTVYSQGDPITIVWHQVEFAEWYGIYCRYLIDTGSGSYADADYVYSRDTTFTFAGDHFNYQLSHADIFLIAVTGPDPAGTAGNVTGDYATGRINSYGIMDELTVNGENVTKNGMTPTGTQPTVTPEKIISGVFAEWKDR
ncbi:MAG: hypothetical protein JW763_02770 [candidate division Zixibacteria bacterium]|nr:hypothetical protein [candidate division Zixibacteria bacterium]